MTDAKNKLQLNLLLVLSGCDVVQSAGEIQLSHSENSL